MHGSPKEEEKLGFSGSVGELFPNTCAKLIATNGEYKEIVGPNQLGELLIRGPQITGGYLNRVKETNEAFVDGWFRTGDEVYYDNNEMFYVNDRVKELIKVSGFQVAPAELEAVIRGYKDVYEVCVIGIPDKRCGEVPRAYVVPKPNSRINIEELQHYVSSKLVRYKHLMGGVVVVNDLPKNASGKILVFIVLQLAKNK
ncbi:hypothetical protein RI129_007578 [Pyrocoelia pectoralis]|uniref:AMP-binding enzyme C-terminal domain-containing protein n=1 Tax=Pyrocoelia pectoralis TaxID=417401 RepID=A0AAN7ZLK5_9COLE